MKKLGLVPFLETAGGRIRCKRCQAKARSGLQCAKPAIRGKRVCRTHGGASSGPKTAEGRQKIRDVNWIHGERSARAIKQSRLNSIKLRKLADALRVLGASAGAKIPGRWPDGYQPLETTADVQQFVIDELVGRGWK